MGNCARLLLVTALLAGSVQTVTAARVRVLVLPFQIYAAQDLSYLGAKISSVLTKNLQSNGAQTVAYPGSADDARRLVAAGPEKIRRTAGELRAGFVIWGSLTRIGRHYSLDAKLIKTFGDRPPEKFFLEGRGMENLAASVERLAQRMALKLFKREKVLEVRVAGNVRIEADAIRRVLKTKPGSVYLPKTLSDDLKAVYAMGYFDDVRIESLKKPGGEIVIFHVKEKPTIRQIRFKGNTIFDNSELLDGLDIKTGSILNSYKVKSNVEQIESMYKEKNYHNVHVTYKVIAKSHNQADLEFDIQEGHKIRIKEIRFEGNQSFSAKKLKGLMKTSEKGILSWFTSSGDLKMADLNQDIIQLAAFYHNHGFIDARVADPVVTYKGKWIYITIKIEEGARYKVGKVDVSGDLIRPKPELMARLKITKQPFFSRQVLRNDVLALTDLYSDAGYAYAEIAPHIVRDKKKLVVNINYNIRKGKLVYFEKIIIGGNTKTRDKVIRRQLRIYEQELYSGKRLKRGIRNLYRLNYFEDVKVDTKRGSAPDKMIVKIDVKEKSTGSFSVGGGYSSVEKVFATGSISQRNLFGRGQILSLSAQLGGRTNKFTLSFTEPWLFDIPLSAGFDAFRWDTDYDSYTRESTGGAIRAGYPIYDYTRLSFRYKFDSSNVTDIDADAAESIKELAGTNVTSSLTGVLRYDSRDRPFNTGRGQNHTLTLEYAGLGGDIGYVKSIAELGFYIPLPWSTTGFLHAEGGYVTENSSGFLPDYERFYLGGINSMRGFDFRDISDFDENGAKIGGTSYVQFNVEYRIPLLKKQGIVGVIFFDAGNVYGQSRSFDITDLRESVGYGFRWYSPMGPIRLENAYIIDPRGDESTSGRWEFAMGAAF